MVICNFFLECDSFTILGKIGILSTVHVLARASTSVVRGVSHSFVLVWRRHNSLNYSSLAIRYSCIVQPRVHRTFLFFFRSLFCCCYVRIVMHTLEWPNFPSATTNYRATGRPGFSIFISITITIT